MVPFKVLSHVSVTVTDLNMIEFIGPTKAPRLHRKE